MSLPNVDGKPVATLADWQRYEARRWLDAVAEKQLNRKHLDPEERSAVAALEATTRAVLKGEPKAE